MPSTDTSATPRSTLTQRRSGVASPVRRINPLSENQEQEVQEPEQEQIQTPQAAQTGLNRGNLERPMIGRPVGATAANQGNVSANSRTPLVNRSLLGANANAGGNNNGAAPVLNRPASALDAEKGSPIKVVVWVIIAIALAVALYFALRNTFQPVKETPKVTPIVQQATPIVTPTPSLISEEVLLDSVATNVGTAANYNLTKQTIGTASEATFSLDTFSGNKYTTFTRFSFGVSRLTGAETILTPQVTAVYDTTAKTITLTFAKTAAAVADGLLKADEQVAVNTDFINLLAHSTANEGADDVYILSLKTETPYYLHLVTTGDRPEIILDVKDSSTVVATPSPTAETTTPETTKAPEVTTMPGTPAPTVSATKTPTITVAPTSATGDILENVYGTEPQELRNGLSSNTADMIGSYAFKQAGSEFTYEKQLSLGSNGKFPNVTAKLETGKLTVVVTNLINKNIAPQTLTFGTAKLVTSVVATRSGNSLTYEFTVGTGKEFRIAFAKNTSDKDVLRIQMK